ncbi:Heat shock protein HslJ [Hymenobacter gelipurpurascens]|uniref:Heat shock protein HslJ n=1 Tax=Hymenobacter gelipurpurascens TaxID=89968 RepID=A0A212UCL9_9BACT|nr:META domain-containing protein [Hymenobacter gelipurpurascens]SNC75995.1 Heat shock protein HslJ [Hymenobacter gelipurpurascens]
MRYLFTLAYCIALLTFVSSCKDKTADSQLLNTHWKLVEIEGSSISTSSYSDTYRSYIEFTGGINRTTGLGPCNSFSGSFALGAEPGLLTISPQGATKISCPALNIETQYLEALPRTTSYQIVGKELRLFDASNTTKPMLIFEDHTLTE